MTLSKVVEIRRPDARTVKLLEETLREVREGKITGIVLLTQRTARHPSGAGVHVETRGPRNTPVIVGNLFLAALSVANGSRNTRRRKR